MVLLFVVCGWREEAVAGVFLRTYLVHSTYVFLVTRATKVGKIVNSAVLPMAWGWSASPWICRRVADGVARTTSCQRCRPVGKIMVLAVAVGRKGTLRYSVFIPSLN